MSKIKQALSSANSCRPLENPLGLDEMYPFGIGASNSNKIANGGKNNIGNLKNEELASCYTPLVPHLLQFQKPVRGVEGPFPDLYI